MVEQIQPVRVGDPIRANTQNRIINGVNRVFGMSGAGGVDVKHTPSGTIIAGAGVQKTAALGERALCFNADQGSNDHNMGEFVSIMGIYNDIASSQVLSSKTIILKTDTYNESASTETPRVFGVCSKFTENQGSGEVIVNGYALALCDIGDLSSVADAHGVHIKDNDRTGVLKESGGDFPVIGVASTAASGTLYWTLINMSGDYTRPVNPFIIGEAPAKSSATPDTDWHPEDEETTEWNPFDSQDQGSTVYTDGFWINLQTRTEYFADSDQILYGYYRTFKFNARGQLYFVSEETRYTIDEPENC